MENEKNWQTVEEFIKQYKPVDEAMKELEEIRNSTALTTGTPAYEMPTIFYNDPVYGPTVREHRAFKVKNFYASLFFGVGAFFSIIASAYLFIPLSFISAGLLTLAPNNKNYSDEFEILQRENNHLTLLLLKKF